MAKQINQQLSQYIADAIRINAPSPEVVEERNLKLSANGMNNLHAEAVNPELLLTNILMSLEFLENSKDPFDEVNRGFFTSHGCDDKTFTSYQSFRDEESMKGLAGMIVDDFASMYQ